MNETDPTHPAPFSPSTDPDMEARVVALILDEVTVAEREAIEEHLAQSPDLRLFRQRIEQVHGLLSHHDVPEDWHLPQERRARVLTTISATSPPSKPRWWTHPVFRIAAVLVILGAITLPFLLPFLFPEPKYVAYAQVSSHENDFTRRFIAEPADRFEEKPLAFEGALARKKAAAEPSAGSSPPAFSAHELPEFRAMQQMEARFSDAATPAPAPLEIDARVQPISKFPLPAKGNSLGETRAALERKKWPDPKTIRIEEFVNAFDYRDPAPTQALPATCQIEQADHPLVPRHRLLRLGLRTAPGSGSPSATVFLNPNRVSRYRIFGFGPVITETAKTQQPEPHVVVSTATVLYEIEINPGGSGELGFVSIDFRDESSEQPIKQTWAIPFADRSSGFADAPPALRLAGLSAWTAAKLKQDPSTIGFDWPSLNQIHAALPKEWQKDVAVQELGQILRLAEEL
jgi:hypothetical protein